MKQYMLLKVLLSVSIVTESVVAPIVVFYIYLLPIVILLVK